MQEFRGERTTLRNFYKEGYGMVTETVQNPRFIFFRERVAGIAEEMES